MSAEDKEIKEVQWRWDYGVYVPFCPYCDEPAYGEDRCFNCGKMYKWVEGKYKQTEVSRGDYKVIQSTNKHISIYKNGEIVYHSQCTKRMTDEELLEQIDFYEEFRQKI